MPLSPLAGLPAPQELLIDAAQLERDYYQRQPDLSDANQLVSFGTSGHRGTSANGSFTESHILAIAQAIVEYRQQHEITGPLYMGKDTHALSSPAQRTALEVFAAHDVETFVQREDGFTPTPSISHAILTYNRGRTNGLADGVVITPSHNPPSDGGFKYNPPEGGPADSDITTWIQDRANQLLRAGNRDVQRTTQLSSVNAYDFLTPYTDDLANVIDMDAIRGANLGIGVDPLGGASVQYWEPIAQKFGLRLTVVNPRVDPTFRFMTVDHDGKIRMDCSSPYAMAGLVRLKDQFAIAWGNDPDADRHGIVTPTAGLLNPNHYLAVAIGYLLANRPGWPLDAVVGKTLVSSTRIDRVVQDAKSVLWEVPVGFKWFAPGLFDGSCCFGGEESAGASFLRSDGTAWSTDKDGLILGLLAAEITARTGKDPGEHYRQLVSRFGEFYYTRVDAPAGLQQRNRLKALSPEAITDTQLAGEPVTAKLTKAPGNQAAIGGLKVVTTGGWFAARPSGTENIYKLYAESYRSPEHLAALVAEAQQVVARALG